MVRLVPLTLGAMVLLVAALLAGGMVLANAHQQAGAPLAVALQLDDQRSLVLKADIECPKGLSRAVCEDLSGMLPHALQLTISGAPQGDELLASLRLPELH